MPTGSQAATRNTRRAEMAAAPVCAVTGANGYVGSILTKALSAAGMRVSSYDDQFQPWRPESLRICSG
jgi:hypothetical protein